MRVSQLSSTLSAGRVYDLLLSGALLPGIAVDSVDGTIGQRLAVVLIGTEDDELVPVAIPGGGFARLVGHVIRLAGVEAYRATDETHFAAMLPSTAAGWIADRSLLWTFLAGGWGVPQGPNGVEPPRRVDSSEALTIARDTPTWTVRLETDHYSGEAALSWLVVETARGGAETDTGTRQPSRVVAAGVQRMRDILGANANANVTVRRQDPTAIPGGRGMMRLDSTAARIYWPMRSFRGILAVLAGNGGGGSTGSGLQLSALQRLVDVELSGYGMLRLLQTAPRTPEERRARPALRTVQELIRSDGAPRRSFADSVYRSGAAYQAATNLVVWLSPTQQKQLRRVFGDRRWEQIHEHGLRRIAGAVGGSSGRLPWNAVSAAAEVLVADLAQRSQQPGRRPPVSVVDIVRRFYTEPRGSRLRKVWEAQIRRGVLADLLEEVFLSQLKRNLPRLPRETLVLCAVGEPQAVRDRIGAVFSRRGRALFTEDVAAAEAAMERGDFADWDRILAARSTLWGVYNRSRTSRGRGQPQRSGRSAGGGS